MPRLTVSPEVLRCELEAAVELVQAQIDKIDAGIPSVTIPGSEVELYEWMTELTGEVMLAARKCENVATTLAEPPGS